MHALIWFLIGCTFTLIVVLALLPRRRTPKKQLPEAEPEPPPAPRQYVLADNRNLETLTRGLGGELASLATSVESHAQRLCEALDKPVLARGRSERLWESVRRLRFLSEKMQSFASVGQLKSRPTRIRPVLQALVHEIEDYAGASLQVSLSTAPSLPMALADADALRLALLFLIEAVLTLEPHTPSLTISAQTELDEEMDAEVLVELEAEAEDSAGPEPDGDIRFSYVAARNLLEAQGAWVSLMHRPGLSVVKVWIKQREACSEQTKGQQAQPRIGETDAFAAWGGIRGANARGVGADEHHEH